MSNTTSRTADIRRSAALGDGRAESLLAALLEDLFAIKPANVAINRDQYSLNSLNGFFDTEDGDFFFKFHQEEGEEAMTGEYYRADILARAGLPVDQPVLMSVQPGEQILVYRRRTDPRFSDVLRALDLEDDIEKRRQVVDAERRLSRDVLSVYLATLSPATVQEVAAEPVHRLFFERLIDPVTRHYPGGRLADFYIGKTFAFPGATLDWSTFASTPFVINGKRYRKTVGQLFEEAAARLEPSQLADTGGVTAHGDAHNANVWYCENDGRGSLSFFDPAFAGEKIPTLLAEVKTTFHNILAHPLWLYDPAVAAETYDASAELRDGLLHVSTNWSPSAVRRDLLEVKAEEMWRPLLLTLRERGMLPADWRTVVRLGLFLCPTLVMNLRAGATTHNETSSLIGFAMAVAVGSEPEEGSDLVGDFLDAIDPERD